MASRVLSASSRVTLPLEGQVGVAWPLEVPRDVIWIASCFFSFSADAMMLH